MVNILFVIWGLMKTHVKDVTACANTTSVGGRACSDLLLVSLEMGLSLMLVHICKILMNTRALSHMSLGSHALVAAELLDYMYSSSTDH